MKQTVHRRSWHSIWELNVGLEQQGQKQEELWTQLLPDANMLSQQVRVTVREVPPLLGPLYQQVLSPLNLHGAGVQSEPTSLSS